MKRQNKYQFLFFAFLFMIGSPVFAQQMTDPNKQSEELGNVQWYRNFDEALTAAEKQNKDVVLLFQEVPGCATCRDYGQEVLAHPLMVDALENLFVPLAIFNNKQGEDREVLELYNEPSWNNPVVRFVDAKGANLTKRINGDYSALTLVKRMKKVLADQKREVPAYLDLLEQELTASSSNIEESTFQMYCFWSGEKNLGKVDGVLDVESGFASGGEVVKVKYNSNEVSEEELVKYAKKQDYQLVKNTKNYRTANNDVHYYLKHSNYKYIPLTEIQKTKINSALGSGYSAKSFLSPSQLEWLNHVESTNAKGLQSLLTKDIASVWSVMDEKQEKMAKK